MIVIPVRRDDVTYLKLLKTNGPTRYKVFTDADLKTIPKTCVIITGDKTKDFGGGPSPDGFLMHGPQMLGIVRIDGKVRDGRLTIL